LNRTYVQGTDCSQVRYDHEVRKLKVEHISSDPRTEHILGSDSSSATSGAGFDQAAIVAFVSVTAAARHAGFGAALASRCFGTRGGFWQSYRFTDKRSNAGKGGKRRYLLMVTSTPYIAVTVEV